jgi:hypothetical protein
MDVCLESYLSSGWLASIEPHPSAVVERFVKEVAAGNNPAVVAMLPDVLRKGIGDDKLVAIFARNRAEIDTHGGLVSAEAEDLWEDTRHAAVELTMRYGDGSSDEELILLVRENADWRVDLTR